MNIYDIAKKAGVSIATVSRVINGSANVSEKSRNKVLKIIEQENYIPNIFAKGLALDSTRTVGILCPSITDINHAKSVSIIERLLRKNNFTTFLISTDNDYEDKSSFLQQLVNNRVDAIVVIGSTIKEKSNNETFAEIAQKTPIVIVNGLIELDNVYNVLCDERTAIIECVDLLYQKCCTNILFISDSETYSGYQKLSGYKEGLKLCGIEENPNLIIKIADSEEILEDTYSRMIEFINSKEKFDAIITTDDILAVAALKALKNKNIDVPVIGFNNSRFSQCSIPEITSVDNMLETICSTATNLLINVLNGNESPSKILISHKIIERDTFKL